MPAHNKTHKNPHADSRLAKFVERRILALSGTKAQKEIAREAGFTNANMLSMIKSGDTKLALDPVPATRASARLRSQGAVHDGAGADRARDHVEGRRRHLQHHRDGQRGRLAEGDPRRVGRGGSAPYPARPRSDPEHFLMVR